MKTVKIVCIVCALAALISLLGCGRLKITDAEALDILNGLIPKAAEINEIFFGAGLPAAYDDAENDDTSMARYVQVSGDCPYRTVADIKRAAEEVYSAKYLSSVYVSMFEGTSAGEEDAAVATISPRYREIGGVLCVNVNAPSYNIRRIASVRTAQITGNAKKRVKVLCDCALNDGTEEKGVELYLTMENGRWVLQSPSY